MATILLADKLHPAVADQLNELGCRVIESPQLTAEELPEQLADVDILVVRSTKVTAAALTAAGPLALIIRAGAGVNTIDVSAASAQGIHVVNCPGVNAAAVAELTIGLMIAADRQIADACADLRSGAWKKKLYSQSHGLKDRTLGILGMGAIGQAVAKIARGMEMNVAGWSRSLTAEKAASMGITFAGSPLELAKQADVVSIHLALTDETKHLVDAQFLEAMRPGAILVNTSRGPLVDTTALRTCLHDKSLKVALDVFEDEPPGGEAEFADTDLANMIVGTPHIGASTEQTSEAIGAAVVDHIRTYLGEGRVESSVNMGNRAPTTHRIVVRHLNRVGVLAGILGGLRKENINVEEMENSIFDGEQAAICTLHTDSAPSSELIESLNRQDEILQVTQFTA